MFDKTIPLGDKRVKISFFFFTFLFLYLFFSSYLWIFLILWATNDLFFPSRPILYHHRSKLHCRPTTLRQHTFLLSSPASPPLTPLPPHHHTHAAHAQPHHRSHGTFTSILADTSELAPPRRRGLAHPHQGKKGTSLHADRGSRKKLPISASASVGRMSQWIFESSTWGAPRFWVVSWIKHAKQFLELIKL